MLVADGSGIVARAIAAVKYAVTGNAPQDWFGPLNPLPPIAPESVKGRQYDYPVGYNLSYVPRSEEPVGFAKLKALAKNCDMLRIVMDGQKDKLEAFEWTIKPREKVGKTRGAVDQSILDIQARLEYPDGEHDWAQWLRALLEQLFVLDAVSIYRRKTIGGQPYSFELLDGATIKPLLDNSGRRPAFPDAAYQQVLKGVPAVDYTTAELLYHPQNVRADHAYGLSRVEQIIITIETQIERAKSQKGFFTHGNISDGFFEAPEGVQPDQVRQVETMWNNLITASTENKRINQFLPGGFKWNQIGKPPLQDEFDEWLARVICFTFSTSPQPFMKQAGLGHGSATTEHAAAEAAGLANLMAYVRRLMNRILIEDFQRPDLEFSWVEDREFDPQTKADIEDKQLRNGSLTLDEVRDRNGEEPLPDGIGSKPMIYTASGPVLVADVVNPPEPPAPAIDPSINPADPNAPGNETKPPVAQQAAKDEVVLTKAASTKMVRQKRLSRIVARFLSAKGKEIAAKLGESLGLAKADPSSEDYSGRIDQAFDDIDWDWTSLSDAVEPILTGVAVAAGKDAVSDMGLFDKDTLAKMTARATDWSQARAAELVGKKLVDGELVDNPGWSIPEATRDMIRSAVTQAMEQGASNDELAKALMESDAFSRSRAETIARTETAMADSQGAIAGWKATGLVGGKQWLAAPDCCDECQDLDGEIVSIDDEFDGGDPPLHPNCRCAVTPVLTDEMPDADSSADDED